MAFNKRGPVTPESSIFHSDGSISVRISTNKWTNDSYILVDREGYLELLGRFINVRSPGGTKIYGDTLEIGVTCTREELLARGRNKDPKSRGGCNIQLHTLLYYTESTKVGLTVDHLVSRFDNRRCAVQFISHELNCALGAPGGFRRKQRRAA